MNNFDSPTRKAETDAAGLRSPRAGSEAMRNGAVNRLAGALAVNEIVRARRFLGTATSEEEQRVLFGMQLPDLLQTAQALTAAVCLRQQTETAEYIRGLMAQQKAAQEPGNGPLVS